MCSRHPLIGGFDRRRLGYVRVVVQARTQLAQPRRLLLLLQVAAPSALRHGALGSALGALGALGVRLSILLRLLHAPCGDGGLHGVEHRLRVLCGLGVAASALGAAHAPLLRHGGGLKLQRSSLSALRLALAKPPQRLRTLRGFVLLRARSLRSACGLRHALRLPPRYRGAPQAAAA